MTGDDSQPTYSVAIREMPSEERPRERLVRYGAQALSNAELIAIVLRTGARNCSAVSLAQRLLSEFRGVRNLGATDLSALCKVHGIGRVKAVQIAACAELGRRMNTRGIDDRAAISCPEDVVDLVAGDLADRPQECFRVLLVDTKNRVQRAVTVSVGILDASLVHPREVFRDAIAASAASVIVAHNHPSGDPSPSAEDRKVTSRLVQAGQIIGIDILDHLIVAGDRWFSFKQHGLL